jgi:hypothetical protein
MVSSIIFISSSCWFSAFNFKVKSAEVTSFVCLIMTVISPEYNKKHLAQMISNNFQTKRSNNLSEKQVYKSMYDDDPRIDELIKEVAFKLLKGGK